MDKFTKEEIQQLITGLELLQTGRFNSIFVDPPDVENGMMLTLNGFLQLAQSLPNKRYQIDYSECPQCGEYLCRISMWAHGQLFWISNHYEGETLRSMLKTLGLEYLAHDAMDVYLRRQEQALIEAKYQADEHGR